MATRTRRINTVLLAILSAQGLCSAAQILNLQGDSLTHYQGSGVSPAATTVQLVTPTFLQRGTFIDGTLRAQPSFAWAAQGNPSGDAWTSSSKLGMVDLSSGAPIVFRTDFVLPGAGGLSWPIQRSFNALSINNGTQGYGWHQASQPEIVVVDADSNPGTKSTSDLVVIVYRADAYIEFARQNGTSDIFKGVNGAAGAVVYKAGGGGIDTYEYYDQTGKKTTFYGGNTTSHKADYQLWKVEDTAGNIVHVGSSTSNASTALDGYNSDGTLLTAWDTRGCRYSYSYTTVGSKSRLASVIVEKENGSAPTWGSAGTETLIAQVDYTYYTSVHDSYGDAGDLKEASVTTPLTDTSVTRIDREYYRYYDNTWSNSDGRRGTNHQLMMILGRAGTDRYDFAQDGAISTSTPEYRTATTANLMPYAEAYFEYGNGDLRLASAYFEGQCGCGGGSGAGTYTFAYADASGKSTEVANTTYSSSQMTRITVTQPDALNVVHWQDETGQEITQAKIDGTPGSSTTYWVTSSARNSSGQVTEIDSPASVDTYTHSTGAVTLKSSSIPDTALVTGFERVASGDMTGFVEWVNHKKQTGTVYYDSKTEYTSSTLTVTPGGGDTYVITRPFVSAVRQYHAVNVDSSAKNTAANYHQTDYTYSFHSSAAVLMPKTITTTLPKISTSNNGAGDGGGDPSVQSVRYLRTDGTVAFSRHPAFSNASSSDLVYDYFQYTNGQLTKSVRDSLTNGSFPGGDDPNGDFGITEAGTGVDVSTNYTYDDNGRSSTVTLPTGRVMRTMYAKLADGRRVLVSIPRDASGTYYGPVGYSVMNQTGLTEFAASIALPSAGSSLALSSWVSSGSSDAISALHSTIRYVTKMTMSIANAAGTRVEAKEVFHQIPASAAAASVSDYDGSLTSYDSMGRPARTVGPSGTITRTVYDVLGRVSSVWMGTDDNSNGALTGGTSNMTELQRMEYDGGSSGGNSLLTTRKIDPDGDWVGTTTDQRITTYTYDLRGRAVITGNPQSPHTLVKYDNLGRAVAVGRYSSTSGQTITTDPSSTSSNRLALSETFYDEAGHAFRTRRHEIVSGSDNDSLDSDTWYDAEGKVVKVQGETFTKTLYDRLDRVVTSAIVAQTDDAGYADADDLTGDVIVEETKTTYESDSSNNVVMSARIKRNYDDLTSGNTGDLDTNADGNSFKYTMANVKGRISIQASWFDAMDRVTDTALYGTNGASDFDRKPSGSWLTVPTRSDTVLVTSSTYTYDDSGTTRDDSQLHASTDPKAIVTAYEFDAQGRRTAEIRNYVNGTPSGATGDDDVYTRFVYDDGHMIKMWLDLDGDNNVDTGDQVTEYQYGTTKGASAGDSQVQTGHLLQKVIYPEGQNSTTTPTRSVTYAYNTLGQNIYTLNQNGTVIEQDYDTAGRLTQRRVTTAGSGIDTAVLRIATAYDSRGFIDTITQYNNATVGSGTVQDQVQYAYDGWGNMTTFTQDVDGVIGAGGRAAFSISYAYAKADPSDARHTIRRSSYTPPSGSSQQYLYGAGGGSLADPLSRTDGLMRGFTPLALYYYVGNDDLVGTNTAEGGVYSYQFSASTGVYPFRDNFDRMIKSKWSKDTGNMSHPVADFIDLEISYDRNSNVTAVVDNFHTNSSGSRVWDDKLTMDGLNRLTNDEIGSYSGGSISGRVRNQNWTLGQAGTWALEKWDTDGDNNYADGDPEYQDTRVYSDANELTTRQLDNNNTAGYEHTYSLVYDAAGQMTQNDTLDFTWDAFGRLRTAEYNSLGSTVQAEYKYNGLGYRIAWHYDADADKDVDASDPWYYFCYDERWRMVATYRASDSNAKERFTYHAAGLNGVGGSGYIDSVLSAERDENSGWTSAADGVLEVKRFPVQNWRGDVLAVISTSGKLVETAKYSAYGRPFLGRAGDTDADGDFDATDSANITGAGVYAVTFDVELDGDVDASDASAAVTGAGGWDAISCVNNRFGYAGYQWTGLGTAQWHARRRSYDPVEGHWLSRDPIGYRAGNNLYQYVKARPITLRDSSGLKSETCSGCGLNTFVSNTRADNPAGSDPLLSACLSWGDYSGCTGCCISIGYPPMFCAEVCSDRYIPQVDKPTQCYTQTNTQSDCLRCCSANYPNNPLAQLECENECRWNWDPWNCTELWSVLQRATQLPRRTCTSGAGCADCCLANQQRDHLVCEARLEFKSCSCGLDGSDPHCLDQALTEYRQCITNANIVWQGCDFGCRFPNLPGLPGIFTPPGGASGGGIQQ